MRGAMSRAGGTLLIAVTWGLGTTASAQGEIPIGIEESPAGVSDFFSDARLGDLSPTSLALVLSPFVLASLIAVWFGVERLVTLRRSRVIPPAFVRKLLGGVAAGTLNQQEALLACDRDRSVAAAVFAEAIRRSGRPATEIEKAVADAGERQVLRLRRNMRAINGVATITPLMGLLGTVLGMMISFVEIAGGSGAGRTEELAFGIVTALSTTAIGLGIAIPALVLYMFLMSRVERLVAEVDDEARHLVDLVCAEGVYGGMVAADPEKGATPPTNGSEPPESKVARPARRTTPLEIPAGG